VNQNKNIIVFGGAGYIGSHAVLALQEAGYSPIIYDNFSNGNRSIATKLAVPLVEGEISDNKLLAQTFSKFNPIAVMHFAAFAYVGESVEDPSKYYHNNVNTTLVLLDELRKAKINNFIFSSTCATYGVPDRFPIDEQTTQNPVNPYGRTKLMVEQILSDFDKAYNFKSVIFRYFNAAGAHPSGAIGELHNPETHLIPLTFCAATGGQPLKVFGNDYDTADGTCIRDYIHVSDIAKAHVLGLEYLLKNQTSDVFNIGTGTGTSVLEIIKSVEKISGKKVDFIMNPRRAGDPAKLVADSQKIKKVLGWNPKHSQLGTIIKTAWDWHTRTDQ